VIHTKVAFAERIGHADFYPNGGGVLALPQPGCPFPDLGQSIMQKVFIYFLFLPYLFNLIQDCCSHCRALALFEESIISPVGFWAKQCESFLAFLTGSCDNNPSILMGEPTPTKYTEYIFL